MKKSQLKQLIREVIEEADSEGKRAVAELNRKLNHALPLQKKDTKFLHDLIYQVIQDLLQRGSFNRYAVLGIQDVLRKNGIDTGILTNIFDDMGRISYKRF